ncbi:MAG: hypothetical protein F4246_03040 [Rhodothermaceae bacterium]|nr:hypothetical protein [Rhodothermaceae bacterium]MYD55973.1 hypothetical protein [Rhodothermaceae bacterium]MYJ55012.1 hypothetical protein [Rhodothermaceae bacterium]
MAKQSKLKPRKDLPVATLKASSYQPNAKELREDLRVDVSFDQALSALVTPVKIKTKRQQKD